jgi:hypothetical protein
MGFDSRRRQVERQAAKLRRSWLAKRDFRARDLSPAVTDALQRWSEAEARLRLADDQAFDRWVLAAQNSAGRLAVRLEELSASAGPSPEEEMRALLADKQWVPPAAIESEQTPTLETETDSELLDEETFELLERSPAQRSGNDVEATVDRGLSPASPNPERTPVHPLAWRSRKGRKGFVDINIW